LHFLSGCSGIARGSLPACAGSYLQYWHSPWVSFSHAETTPSRSERTAPFAAAIAQLFPIVETLQWCGPGTGDVHSQESQHLRSADCSARIGLIPYLVP
jgi:hypothetical protein